ncbi:hypothetical protein [Paenibacillus sp. PK3_47]|uniref:hypothetical protein n=1 Tax=Paenibacillus sp. PK3_47 TaxID=2072642 RepID=UPI00201D8FE3|nr:hypothetical protein [Paenibacillus sp. PK3_47]
MTSKRDIFIVLTGTGTAFSGLIKWFTKAELNHASIAFDSELQEVYSFGRKNVHNPFNAGLIRENFIHPFYNNADCAIYQLRVTDEEYETMHNHVMSMMQHQDRYKYHLLGLIGVLLNVKFDRADAYFCSHFVASLFEETALRPVAKPSCFVTPEDFAASLCAHKIFSGKLSYYLQRVQRPAYAASVIHKGSSGTTAALAARIMRVTEERTEGIV